MKKTMYLLMTGFLVLGLCLGGDHESEASQQVMHVSERVKIKRPEKPPVVEEKETNAAEQETPRAEMQVATIDDQKKVKEPPANPVSLSVPKRTAAGKNDPELKPKETPVADVSVLEESSDLVDEKQALFGDQEKYYVKKGRIDPFEPFLHKPEPKTVDIRTEEVQRRAPRTPLERIALGQLKLTAVMRLTAEQMQMAMVEDNNGKGYIVKKGTYIGENGGRVSGIEANKVIVEEKYNDVFGKISVRQIELKLQNQPGE